MTPTVEISQQMGWAGSPPTVLARADEVIE
jgi:hypothetical protein